MKMIARFLLVSFFLTSYMATVYAQSSAVDRGSINIGGDATFSSFGSSADTDDSRTTQLLFNPAVEYFIIPGLAVGGEVVLARASRDGSSSSTVGVGPRLSYYFGRGERTFYPYLSGTVSLLRTSFDGNGDQESNSSVGYRGSGGILFMLSQGVGITGEVFYQGRDSDDFNTNAFGVSFGISAFVF